jgi:DNA-binding NarL/FixJ family response regulator
MSEIPAVELLVPTMTEEATLESLRAHKPEVLVVDTRILSGKGREFVEAVRKNKPDIVLVIMSNIIYSQHRKYYEAAGADLILDKSNSFDHLYQFIGELAGGPKNQKYGASQHLIRKRLALAKLKVGIQLGLIAFSAYTAFPTH